MIIGATGMVSKEYNEHVPINEIVLYPLKRVKPNNEQAIVLSVTKEVCTINNMSMMSLMFLS